MTALRLPAPAALAALFLLPAAATPRGIAIEWQDGAPQGEVRITRGTLSGLRVARGTGTASGARFQASSGPFRLEFDAAGSEAAYGSQAAIVTVAGSTPFSFFLRDATRAHPVFIPAYGVAVTEAADPRSSAVIASTIRARGLQTNLQQIEAALEETFDIAAAETRRVACQTWLGLSRDIRIFALSERLDWVEPRLHGQPVRLPETGDRPLRYTFLMGRGWSALDRISRRLEDGVLPILHGTLDDGDVTYQFTAFTGLERRPLTAQAVRGTHFLVADGHGGGHMFTPEQQAEYNRLAPGELDQPEETVLYLRMTAVNTRPVPRYAFFKNPAPPVRPYTFDGASGLGLYPSGRVFAASLLNGRPLAEEEVAIELPPGGQATLDVFLPHRPVPRDRALALARQSFADHHAACRRFWQEKLAAAGRIRLPERRIGEMLTAGLLHLDLITYGLEPAGTLTSTIGTYSAIGSESSPIIQFFDSMGLHDTARRALMYFLAKQHPDGLIQNFGGYMLETGAALWSMGEHFRYTRDEAWVRQIAPQLLKSCDYLLRWRERNLREDLRGKGYGMLDGKTADPEDPFRSFMLNGYAYLGLARVSEMLRAIDPAQSARLDQAAQALRGDIRTALAEAMANSPVIPLADGTWCPTAPPWAGYRGPLSLYADGGSWFTHGAMASRDSLLGPLYLVFQEVLDPREPAAGFLLNFHNDLMTRRNAAFSQPYYSRHADIHLRRGEVKPFLKAYYNTVASLADRDTYTFWEHYYGASPHKTHEEAWFLMSTRWMLWLERGEGLELLSGIPRRYLEDGREIALENVATYFGPLSLRVASHLGQNRIEARIECASPHRPRYIELRLPHPLGLQAARVEGGAYDSATERVRIEPFTGRAEIAVFYGPR